MKKVLFVCGVMAFSGWIACSEENTERKNTDAYCYMLEQCQLGDYHTCYNSTNSALAQEPDDECRAARTLLLDCLGHLQECQDYMLWSQAEPGSGTYPCSDQDNLVKYVCGSEN